MLRTKLSSTDYSSTARSSYEFFPDSLLFKQYWKDGDGRNTCTFRFNEKGLLIESVEYSNEQSSPYYHFKTLYEYNSKGQCIRKIVSTVSEYYEKWLRAHEKELGSRLSRGYTMELFYTGDKLDSTVKKYYFPTYPKQEYTSKTYYDERGLKYKTVDKDTLVTRYIHVRRK